MADTKPKKENDGSYGASQISVLEGLEAVRRRPGMYIGSTGPEGLHHLIWEIVDNSFDEAMAGHCDEIVISLLPDGYVSVSDNGRGIPVDIHKEYKVSALELVLTKLHAGGKFGGGGYKVSGGLHGVGASVVNALSNHLKAEVKSKDGQLWAQEFKRGVPTGKVKAIGKYKGRTGTTITFQADDSIFTTTEYNWDYILTHLRQQAYLTSGVRLVIRDERTKGEEKEYGFYFEGGIRSYVRHLNHQKEAKHQNIFYVHKEAENVDVEVSFQYTEDYKESVLAFANNITNPDGGSHVAGFRSALTRSLNNYARKQGFLKEKDDNISGEDAREGLTAIISVKVTEPQFEGQTKAKLGNPEAKPAVEGVFSTALDIYLEEHPADGRAIIEKCLLAVRARLAARAARDTVLRKGALEGLTLPGKLADCSSRDASQSELFIVEGDSAGGSAKQGRDRKFQAILPLRGKILNVERARLDKILINEQVKNLIIALGTNIGEQFEIEKLRYGRIVLMTDADVDGAHIRTLLLTLFYRYFPELIRRGNLFIAQPPLFRVSRGKEFKYAFTEEERDRYVQEFVAKKAEAAATKAKNAKDNAKLKSSKSIAELADNLIEEAAEEAEPLEIGDDAVVNVSGVTIQRYKGLGEMNADQLWETTMDPVTRLMQIVTIDDAEKADEIFDILMGSDVEPRKRFIQTRAKSVKNLDI